MDRPALQQLMTDVGEGRVDQIVVYKIDRLTRSLADFSKIVDVLDAAEASFVSVTQSFNTATSMERLTLNRLLSFAQFEREVTAEPIRDKIAASKRKGLWMGGLVPFGCGADGRTLTINAAEAETIATLYAHYEEHSTVRAVKQEADALGLRSRLREGAGGAQSGGNAFDRAHIHHLLTNPIYAGRIRHRDKVFEGQHPAIIDPERRDRIQQQMQKSAAKGRGRSPATLRSLLCGKLFDETGDRLTPSNTKTRHGTRLRYYIPHRLVARSGETHNDAWRLPAPELEDKTAQLVRGMIFAPGFASTLLTRAAADRIGLAAEAFSAIAETNNAKQLLDLIARIDRSTGHLTLTLGAEAIADLIDADPDELTTDARVVTFPFQLRKRGVETKIILADAPEGMDETLIRNIADAHAWFERIKAGETFARIAETETTSKRRIQQIIGLAFLAPDIVRDVMAGNQPLGFTSDWCLRHNIPSDWTDQRTLISAL